jgi:hypothetical protein
MEEHTTEWWIEYYCQTCGHESKVKFDSVRKKKPQRLPPAPPTRRKKKDE